MGLKRGDHSQFYSLDCNSSPAIPNVSVFLLIGELEDRKSVGSIKRS